MKLTGKELRTVQDAIVQLNIARGTLLTGLPKDLRANLQVAGVNNAEAVLADLEALNDHPGLGDGTLPLAEYLENALHTLKQRHLTNTDEYRTLTDALEKVRRAGEEVSVSPPPPDRTDAVQNVGQHTEHRDPPPRPVPDPAKVKAVTKALAALPHQRLLPLLKSQAGAESLVVSDDPWTETAQAVVTGGALADWLLALLDKEQPEVASAVRALLGGAARAPGVSGPPPRPAVAPAPRPVRIVHISDLHFSKKRPADRDDVLSGLLTDVALLRREVGDLHLIVVTGDIADRGTPEEYSLAATWLEEQLCAAAALPRARIRVVAGNHDVDRTVGKKTARATAAALVADEDRAEVEEYLGDPAERQSILVRQAAFLDFARRYHPTADGPWWTELIELNGWRVNLTGLNSAWLSGFNKTEHGKVQDARHLLVGMWQCQKLLPAVGSGDLSIALLHHPWEDLAEWERRDVEERVRHRCNVVLRGHLHDQRPRLISDPDRGQLELAAGASYAGSKWKNGWQLVELNPGRTEATIHLRYWTGHKWAPDRNAYEKAPTGTATLPLPPAPA